MRTILIAAALAGCTHEAAPATQATEDDPYRYDTTGAWRKDAGVTQRLCNYPLVRKQQIDEQVGVPGIKIGVTSSGAAAWQLEIENGTDGMASVLWDESSFVSKDGSSGGRLIPGETRKMDIANAHPPTPVAPHARLSEFVLVEKMVDVEETEATIEKNPGVLRSEFATKFRRAFLDATVDGHMYLTIATASGKHTWTGLVADFGNDTGGMRPCDSP